MNILFLICAMLTMPDNPLVGIKPAPSGMVEFASEDYYARYVLPGKNVASIRVPPGLTNRKMYVTAVTNYTQLLAGISTSYYLDDYPYNVAMRLNYFLRGSLVGQSPDFGVNHRATNPYLLLLTPGTSAFYYVTMPMNLLSRSRITPAGGGLSPIYQKGNFQTGAAIVSAPIVNPYNIVTPFFSWSAFMPPFDASGEIDEVQLDILDVKATVGLLVGAQPIPTGIPYDLIPNTTSYPVQQIRNVWDCRVVFGCLSTKEDIYA